MEIYNNGTLISSSKITGDTLANGSTVEYSGAITPEGWTQITEDKEHIYIGCQVLYDYITGTAAAGVTNLIGSYDYKTIEGVFYNVTIPTGYHKEYKLSFQATDTADYSFYIWLNNLSFGPISEWAANTYRTYYMSDYFRESDITLEQTMNYTTNGVNLKYQVVYNQGAPQNWWIWAITIHGYIVAD